LHSALFRQGETTSSSQLNTNERRFCFIAPRTLGSGFNEAVPGQGGVSDRHRQAAANLVTISARNTGPEIAITAVVHAPADVSS
jgi:hypothetical protein